MNYQEWKDILNKKNKTPDDLDKMRYHSCQWDKCAVGAKFICDLTKEGLLPSDGRVKDANDLVNAPNGYRNSVINDEIYYIGNNQFPLHIRIGDYKVALKILDDIYNTENIYASPEQKKIFLEHQKE